MKHIHLEDSWMIKASVEEVFSIIADFENMPKNFPKVAESITITKQEGNNLEIDAQVRSFGISFPVQMKTIILPQRGFISDNQSPKFGTSGHEELLLEKVREGTRINYVYEVDIHKKWLRIVAKPLIGWFAMKTWEKAVVNELKKILEK
ncbi:MAG: SRPBCC family protein [Parcubacteria group bacterium]|jgi:carbon monoxide dehydrogenase subunit G|nr:SRPBCC family protein [Candidatus Moranbacteria bacterium]MDX9855595.1 SRPBCC family protein [Candidatus Moranbacteria bacterium]